ncbi:hypothetical protein Jab_2c22980 [Janthinobacterium sp. HH01]|nr:hypothetical protein Jab_2c22980 [Janthinobacterium sp. HH01]
MDNPHDRLTQYVARNFDCWMGSTDHINIEYIVVHVKGEWVLSNAKIILIPEKMDEKINDAVETSEVIVGHVRTRLVLKRLQEFVRNLQVGRLKVLDVDYAFAKDSSLSTYSPSAHQKSDYSVPQLEIRVDQTGGLSQHINMLAVNNELRSGRRPFDGLHDLLTYYQFSRDGHFPNEQKISLSLRSPTDFDLNACTLSENRLTIQVRRRSGFTKELLAIGVRQFPVPHITRRMQVIDLMTWKKGSQGFDIGRLQLDLEECTTVELMLTAGGFAVQQVFITDKNKSLNPRLAAYKKFDPDLKCLDDFLEPEMKSGRDLEQGVATLLYLLGAVCTNPPATDAPDIFAETRSGRLAIVECTVKLTDVRAKAAKLISRRHALTFNADGSGPTHDLLAVLVVSMPKIKIPLEDDFLAKNQILLVTREGLQQAKTRLEFPPDLDELYLGSVEHLKRQMSAALGLAAPFA